MKEKIPSGTVTFLFTDIEGSTGLWERHPQQMQTAFKRQETILREAVAHFGGYPYKMIGDAFQVAFETAPNAICAALEAQRNLQAEAWGETPIRVRMALHTGVTEERGDDYVGPELNRLGRLLSAGYGGQVLLTQPVYDLTQDHLPPNASLRDLGAHSLKDLIRSEHIYQLEAPDLPSEFPPLKTLEAYPHNLPIQLSSFIGRETEMLRIKLLLTVDKARILTLTGPGGTGKTRLALQAAADLLEAFKDGIWLVELAPLADPALVPQSVAAAMNVRQVPGKEITTVLIEYLRLRRILLILDNCEHVVEACASLANSLLQACPNLQIMATSREILGMAGEVPFRVPSLSLPDLQHAFPLEVMTQSEALRLFVERAAQASPNFELSSANAPVIAHICSRLDGIPLAIELAAARVRLLSVEQIASRLDDAFRLLTGGSRTVLPRQQTLKASIDWSYELLTQPERLLLACLSVFAGGWTLEAAEVVCSNMGQMDVFNLLAQLVDKSLVLVIQEIYPETRYRMLETIRQYAREKASETGIGESVRNRHLDYYLHLTQQAAPHLRTKDQVAWLDRLEIELDNLRTALDWSFDTRISDGLELSTALLWFWHIYGHGTEGIGWLEKFIEAPALSYLIPAKGDETHLKRANALLALGFLSAMQFQLVETRKRVLESLEIFKSLGDAGKQGIAFANLRLAGVTEDANQSQALYEESLALSRQLGDSFIIAEGLQGLGGLLMNQGNLADARAALEENLALRRELGDQDGEATALNIRGILSEFEGDYLSAQRFLEQSLACYQSVKNQRFISNVTINLANLAWLQEDYAEAVRRCQQVLAMSRESDSRDLITSAESFLGIIEWTRGNYELAKQKGQKALLTGQEWKDNQLMSSSYFLLGGVALSQGDLLEAETNFRSLVEISHGEGFGPPGLSYLLSLLATLSRRKGQLVRAVVLFSVIAHLFSWADNVISPVERRQRQAELDALRIELSAEAFATAWGEGQAFTMNQALTFALEEYQ